LLPSRTQPGAKREWFRGGGAGADAGVENGFDVRQGTAIEDGEFEVIEFDDELSMPMPMRAKAGVRWWR